MRDTVDLEHPGPSHPMFIDAVLEDLNLWKGIFKRMGDGYETSQALDRAESICELVIRFISTGLKMLQRHSPKAVPLAIQKWARAGLFVALEEYLPSTVLHDLRGA